MGGWSLPAQVSIANSWQAFEGDRLVDSKTEERCRALGRELVRFTRLHSLEPELEKKLMRVIDENL